MLFNIKEICFQFGLYQFRKLDCTNFWFDFCVSKYVFVLSKPKNFMSNLQKTTFQLHFVIKSMIFVQTLATWQWNNGVNCNTLRCVNLILRRANLSHFLSPASTRYNVVEYFYLFSIFFAKKSRWYSSYYGKIIWFKKCRGRSLEDDTHKKIMLVVGPTDRNAFTYRRFFTAQNLFSTERLLNTERNFIPTNFYTLKLFYKINFYTKKSFA